MALPDLTSLAAVKAWLDLTDPTQTDDDAVLSSLITAVSGFIRRRCGRDFSSLNYVAAYDGSGSRRLVLGQYPITAVSSVSINGNSIPPGDAVRAHGYYFNETLLMLHGFVFHRGLGNVTVAYTAGLATIPSDLEQACIELVGARYRQSDRIGMTSKFLAGEKTLFFTGALPASVQAVLDCHTRVMPS